MKKYQIVIDTNVLLIGLRSQYGASYRLLQLVGENIFDIHTSVTLILEYENVLLREKENIDLSENAILEIINYHCQISTKHKIYYIWRPYLPDPKDDHILELAVAANADFILTYNIKDFDGTRLFGIKAIPPKDFLRLIGDIK